MKRSAREEPTRLSASWRDMVRATGRWDDPPFWREQPFLAQSPWPQPLLERGASAMHRMFPAKTVPDLLRDPSSHLWALLADPLAPWMSYFLSFGLRADIAQAWRYHRLVERLQDRGEFEGAAFELDVMAGLEWAEIPYDYEPFHGEDGPDPDFVINAVRPFVLEVKLPRDGARVAEEEEWFRRLTLAGTRTNPIPERLLLPANIELTDKFRSLQESEDGRRWIRANIARLEEAVRKAAGRLSLSRALPVEGRIEGLIQVRVLDPRSKAGGHRLGLPSDAKREAARMVRNLLVDGSNQIPHGMEGVVLLKANWHTSPGDLQDAITEWFLGDGLAYDCVVGAVVVAYQSLGDPIGVNRIHPTWRVGYCGPARDANLWRRFELGFNRVELEAIQWLRSRDERAAPRPE